MISRLKSGARVLLVAACLAPAAAPVAAQQETWTYFGFQNVGTSCIAVAPGDSNLMLVGGGNLSVTHDGGQTWETKTSASTLTWVTFGSTKNLAFAASWGYGLWKSVDGCNTWFQKGAGITSGVIHSVCVSPTDDNTVYACAETGLFKSTNAGESFTLISASINAGALGVAPTNPQRMYLGSWGSGVFKSTNGGQSWTKLTIGTVPDYVACYDMKVDPVDENTVYVIFQTAGAWVSRDGGANWQVIQPYLEGFSLALDKQRPGFVYGVGGWTTPKRSGDYGATGWHDMAAGYTAGFARAIAIDPNDLSKIYVCGHLAVQRWTADVTAPNPPSSLTATALANGIRLNWTPSTSPDCSGYLIYRRESSGSYPSVPYTSVTGGSQSTTTDINVTAGTTYCYKVCAIDNAQNHSSFTNEASATALASIDLDVTYIQRLPRDTYFYECEYPESIPILRAGTENYKRWPAFGEIVTFVAHFINHGTVASGAAHYRWKINGNVMGTGTAPSLAPGQEGTASLGWAWNVMGIDTDHTDQTVTFEIDYDSQIAESFEQNNSLTDYLEGVCLDFWIEPALYDALNRRLNLVGTYSGEDWAQAQIKAMNDDFAASTYPLAPNGVLERVRIDRLIVGNMVGDNHADGRWMVSGGDGYAAGWANGVDNGLIHELMHQLGIIDLYQIRLTSGFNEVITPDGIPNGTDYFFGRPGIMAGGDIAPHTSRLNHTTPEYVESHSALGLNRNCGYRRGYYGEYMFDIPTNNYILVRDSAGVPAPNVSIKVYMIQGGTMSGTPVSTGLTGADGKRLLTNLPIGSYPPEWSITTATNHTEHANPFGLIGVAGLNAILLIEMSRPGGDFDYRYMDITQFNDAYWSGETDSATYTINSRLASCSLGRVTTLNGAVEATSVKLAWSAAHSGLRTLGPAPAYYRIYKAAAYRNSPNDPTHQYENWVYRPIATIPSSTYTYTDTGLVEPSRYAVAAVELAGRESPLSNRLFAPLLRNPWAVGVQADNGRVVLDPQNGYALIRQDGEGRYITNFGSVHYHLEWSRFLAIDRTLGRLIISHPSDEYGGYQSVRVADLDANPLFEIGTVGGSAPGQFNVPTGVAVDAESRVYAMDNGNNRIQIFDSNGGLITFFGSAGSGPGQFNDAQGIAVDSRHRIYVCDKGNARVQILQFDGSTVSYVGTLPKTFNQPMAAAIGPGDNVFVSDYGASRIDAFSAYGNWLRSYTSPSGIYSGALSGPTGMSVDSAGKLVVCDTGNRRVVSIDVTEPISVHQARQLPSGSAVQLEGKAVTARFDGYFYVQDLDRTPGVRIVWSQSVSQGQMVDVYGTLRTTGGEREVVVISGSAHAMAPVQPWPHALNLRTMGGGPSGPVPGIAGAGGLNNVGLLIRAFGKTSDKNPANQEFYLDDGSGFKVRVYAPGLQLPENGSYVTVTGISGAEGSAGNYVRVLRARAIETL
jgi:photosystem II stability/assembly factor-like uncharacterized protein